MRRSLPLLVGSISLVLAACSDQGPAPATTTPAVARSVQTGPHFFFLPPLANNQSFTGEFNPNLAPVVEICRLTGQNGTCIANQAPISFTTNVPGRFGELITVSLVDQMYSVGWKTGSYRLPNYSFWRITVRTAPGGGTVFGFTDVWVAKAANELKNTPAGSVGILNTSTVPIKFRIEEGALCADPNDCFEGTITSDGGTFTVPDGVAGLQAPAGAVDPGTVVNLVIERYHGPDPCLPVFDPQFEGCYRYYTEPHVEQFNFPVIVGQCLDLAGQAVYDQLALWKWDEVDPNTLIELPSADASGFITCPEELAANAKSGLFAGGLKLLKPLASLFGVKPLYAAPRVGPPPVGGGLLDLSRIGPRQQLSITKVSGDNQSAVIGTGVNLTISVTSTKTGEPIAGVPVDFVALTGGSATAGTTDAAGIASSVWTLGSVGANSLRADGNNPRPIWPGQPGVFGSVNFAATGLVPQAVFLAPIGTNVSGPNLTGFPITVRVCEVLNEACGTVLIDLTGVLSNDGSFYQADWITPSTLDPSKVYRIALFVGSTVVESGSVKVIPLSGGGFKAGNFQFTAGQTVPVTFKIQTP